MHSESLEKEGYLAASEALARLEGRPVERVWRKLVIIESPFAGDVERNVAYAKRALLHSLSLGEAPIAFHLLYPQVLDDSIPELRKVGIEAGLAWRKVCQKAVFYLDLGVSEGMLEAKRVYLLDGIYTETRIIGK